jgi:hypothetical protein
MPKMLNSIGLFMSVSAGLSAAAAGASLSDLEQAVAVRSIDIIIAALIFALNME